MIYTYLPWILLAIIVGLFAWVNIWVIKEKRDIRRWHKKRVEEYRRECSLTLGGSPLKQDPDNDS